MPNEIKISIRVDDDGSLQIVGNEAKAAASELDNVSKSTDKTAKSSGTLNRNLKGTAAMTSNGTKQFSKMSQGMTGGLVPAYAILASNIFAVSAAFNFLKRAADVQILEKSQVQFAQNSGVALKSITQRLREASDGMLGFQEAGQAAAIGLAKGFSPSQLEDLAEGAKKASTALGRDFADSFDRLVRGASKAEPELLDELGITLRLEEATQKYADAIGKNRDELNTYQRSQAVLIETQRQLNKNFGDFEAATNPFVKLSKTFEDLIKSVTQFFMPAFTALAEIINRSAIAAVAVFAAIGITVIKAINPMEGFRKRIKQMNEDGARGYLEQQAALEDYIRTLKKAAAVASNAKAKGTKGVKDDASAMVASGSTNKTLKKVAGGGKLSGLDKNNINKALKSAEMQYKTHGKVVTGMFAGQDIKRVRSFGKHMKMMESKAGGTFKRITSAGKVMTMSLTVLYKGMGVAGRAAFNMIGRAADKLGKKIGKLIGIASGVGIAIMIAEMVMQIVGNLFSISLAFAKMLDAMLNAAAPFINDMVRSFLGMVDSLVNGFRGMGNSIKTMFHGMKKTIAEFMDKSINLLIDQINKVIVGLNDLPTGLDQISEIGKVDYTKAVGEVTGLNLAISDLRGEYVGLAGDGTLVEDSLRNSGFGAWAFNLEAGMSATKKSNEALKQYNSLLDTGAEDLQSITEGMSVETDAVKRNTKAFKGLASLDIPGLYAKINSKQTVTSRNLAGELKQTESYVMSSENRAKALEQLKIKLGAISQIAPEMGAALNAASLEADGGLEKLGIQVVNAATNLAFFTEGLGNTKQEVLENIGTGAFRAAYHSLDQLKTASTEAGTAIGILTGDKNQLALKNLNEKFKIMFGEKQNADVLLQQLGDLVLLQDKLAVAEARLGLLTGDTLTMQTKRIEQYAANLALGALELKQQNAKSTADKAELQNAIDIARVKKLTADEDAKRTGAARGQKYGMSNLIKFIKVQDNAREMSLAYAAALKVVTDAKLTTAGASKEMTDNLKAAKMAMAIEGTFAMADTLKDFGAEMAKFGPEGELVAAMSTGLGNVMGSLAAAMSLGTDATMSEKVEAGLGVAMAAVTAMSAIQQAASDAKIRGIDREIAAEKKRDGTSAGSIAKLKAMEAKKESIKRKAFEQDKKMKMAQVVLATAMGAMQAYSAFVAFSPVVAGIMAGMVIAFGAKQLSIISGMSYQGGGSAQSAPSSISVGERKNQSDLGQGGSAKNELAYFRGAQGTGGPENFKPAFSGYKHRAAGGTAGYVVGEQGPELFMPDTPGTIVPADDVQNMGAGGSVNINISAIDASGVESVLMEQRGNIISMLREAANSYGEDFMEDIDESTYTTPSVGRA